MHRWIRKLLRLLILLVVIGSLILILFRTKFHGTIRSLAETQVKNTTSDLINDAIDKQIDVGNIQYDRIVYFEKDLEGAIVCPTKVAVDENVVTAKGMGAAIDFALKLIELLIGLETAAEISDAIIYRQY